MLRAPVKCKMLVQHWIGSKPNHVLAREQSDEVDRFSYLANCISPDDRISESAIARTKGSIEIH